MQKENALSKDRGMGGEPQRRATGTTQLCGVALGGRRYQTMAPDLAYDQYAGRRHSSHLVYDQDAGRRHTQDWPKMASHSANCWEVFIAKSPFGRMCCVRYRMLEACESERR